MGKWSKQVKKISTIFFKKNMKLSTFLYLFDSKKSIIVAPYRNSVKKEIYREKEGAKGKKSGCCKKYQKREWCVCGKPIQVTKWPSRGDDKFLLYSTYRTSHNKIRTLIKDAPLLLIAATLQSKNTLAFDNIPT